MPPVAILSTLEVLFLVVWLGGRGASDQIGEARERLAISFKKVAGALKFRQTRSVMQHTAIPRVCREAFREKPAVPRETFAELRDAVGEAGPVGGGGRPYAVAQPQATKSRGKASLPPSMVRDAVALRVP